MLASRFIHSIEWISSSVHFLLFNILLYNIPQFIYSFRHCWTFELFPKGFSQCCSTLNFRYFLCTSEKKPLHAFAPVLATDAVTLLLDTCQHCHGMWVGKGVLFWPDFSLRQALRLYLRREVSYDAALPPAVGDLSQFESRMDFCLFLKGRHFFFCSSPPVATGTLKAVEFAALPLVA